MNPFKHPKTAAAAFEFHKQFGFPEACVPVVFANELEERDKQWQAKYTQAMETWAEQNVERDTELSSLRAENQTLRQEIESVKASEERAMEFCVGLSLTDPEQYPMRLKAAGDKIAALASDLANAQRDRDEAKAGMAPCLFCDPLKAELERYKESMLSDIAKLVTLRQEKRRLENERDTLREALSGLSEAVSNMRAPQNSADSALQVMLSIGPALSAAWAALAAQTLREGEG